MMRRPDRIKAGEVTNQMCSELDWFRRAPGSAAAP